MDPWTHIDDLHWMILDHIRGEFGLGSIGDSDLDHLNRAWHRLAPWPDVVQGLTRLKRHYVITTLSNGNFSLLIDLAKHGGLPWDGIISADLFNHYKPDPETYQGTARLLNIAQDELMLVASHPNLRAARGLGTRTAYVKRPLEHGPAAPVPEYTPGEFDLVAEDFIDLARRSS
jgi:2-haloacid dehalogenase